MNVRSFLQLGSLARGCQRGDMCFQFWQTLGRRRRSRCASGSLVDAAARARWTLWEWLALVENYQSVILEPTDVFGLILQPLGLVEQ